MIVSKYNAYSRFKIFQQIKIKKMQNGRDLLDNEIIECVQNINQEKDLIDVFNLYGVRWSLDIFLMLRKMEFICMKKEPIDDDYVSFIECLNKVHDIMLEEMCT